MTITAHTIRLNFQISEYILYCSMKKKIRFKIFTYLAGCFSLAIATCRFCKAGSEHLCFCKIERECVKKKIRKILLLDKQREHEIQ